MNVYQKVEWIRSQCGDLKKRGYNKFHNYHYHTKEDMQDAARKLCHEIGLLTIPQIEAERERTLTTVKVALSVINIDNPEDRFVVNVVGQGEDSGDKGIGKAVTSADKQALMALFWFTDLPSDPESDTSTDKRAAAKQTTATEKMGLSWKEVDKIFKSAIARKLLTEEQLAATHLKYNYPKPLTEKDSNKIIDRINEIQTASTYESYDAETARQIAMEEVIVIE